MRFRDLISTSVEIHKKLFRFSFHTKWSVEGQQSVNGTDWKSAAIDIFESFNYDIIIQGVRGDNFYSDIAIDDIIVTSSPCRK